MWEFLKKWQYQAFLPVRIGLGILFLYTGYGKLMDIAGTTGTFTQIGIPAAGFFVWVVMLVELLGGIALIVGYWTRWAALLLSIVLLVAILTVGIGNFGGSDMMMVVFSMKDIALLGATLTLWINGSGGCALDNLKKK